MEHPLLILVPWAVFAGAVGMKVWRVYWTLQRRSDDAALRVERFRATLDRNWAKGRPAA
ncbi:hypothetical protein [Cyanobium sp. ATX-6F1]|uniref:hypothetical protein n=1 Tax=Cyanobium sp. ATX-6F1 TaxID=3137388 RepID=UPI0039BDF834